MLVRQDIILPHVSLSYCGLEVSGLSPTDVVLSQHYDFHYFMINKTLGYTGPLFPYASDPTPATPQNLLHPSSDSQPQTPKPSTPDETSGLQTAAQRKQQAAIQPTGPADSELEGFNDDPSLTKVVDRRWYEKNKHIYPASVWEEYDPSKDYTKGIRKDASGNSLFFT